MIPACRKHVVAATGPSPFKVGDNQRPEGPCPVPRKPPPESSVPGENLPWEVGGINCGGDMGVRRCLARSLTSLALLRTPKSERALQQFIPAGFLHNQLPTGTEDSASPSPPGPWPVKGVLQPQLNLHSFDVPPLLGYNKIKFIQNAQASAGPLPAPTDRDIRTGGTTDDTDIFS